MIGFVEQAANNDDAVPPLCPDDVFSSNFIVKFQFDLTLVGLFDWLSQ